MLIHPRCCAPVLTIALFICTPSPIYARYGSHSEFCSDCSAIAPALASAQDQQTGGSSADLLVESLERALSEGKAQKAHDLLMQILKRPHLTSDFLLRLGIQFAEREWYAAAAETFQRCIREHPQ